MKNIVLSLAFCLIAIASFAQKPFTGVIKYQITYPDLPEEMEMMRGMLPTETVQYIKKHKTKVEQTVGAGSTITITDSKKGETSMLMDMMGQRIHVKYSAEDQEAQREKLETVKTEKTDETKEIAGYKCQLQYITVSTAEGEVEMEVWVTDDINVMTQNYFSDMEGYPMEFDMTVPMAGFTMKMTVSEVSVEKVSGSTFKIPSGYTEMTLEELQSLGGGM